MNRIQASVTVARIELHWAVILWYQRRGFQLIERGEPLTSERLQKYSQIIDRHGMQVLRLEKLFE